MASNCFVFFSIRPTQNNLLIDNNELDEER